MSKGFVISKSGGQKLTTRSSTEGELVAVDDCMSLILWAREFLIAQGVQVRRNIILQDNMSSILLEENGRASSGKRMRHINIRYYFVTDRKKKGECEIKWIPRENMVADYLTKGLQGGEFRRFRDVIMGSAELIQCIE
jgi:small nuclear ribonucleoprotein (snRNP)-like protein